MGKKPTYQALATQVKVLEKKLNTLREAEKKWRESEGRLQKGNKRLLQYQKRLKSVQQNIIKNERLKVFYQTASFVVHDLRRSISFLSLFTENLVKKFGVDPFLKESSEAITNEIKKVRGLIDTLSNLRHDFRLEFQKCNINDLLMGVVNTFQPSSNIKIIGNLSDLPLVECDFRNLQTVFYNVIKNSFEAMPNGGELVVSADTIKGHYLRRKWRDFIRVSITDTGYGIPSHFLKNGLFEPFHTTKEKGLGIGLYQSREIVKRHKGKIEIKSKQNKGTTCIITLPISHSLANRNSIKLEGLKRAVREAISKPAPPRVEPTPEGIERRKYWRDEDGRQMEIERRSFWRVACEVPISCSLHERKKKAKSRKSMIVNISSGGVMFPISRPITPHSLLDIDLFLPLGSFYHTSGVAVKAIGEVRWVRKVKGNKIYNLGVQFFQISDENREKIANYVYA